MLSEFITRKVFLAVIFAPPENMAQLFIVKGYLWFLGGLLIVKDFALALNKRTSQPADNEQINTATGYS